MKALLLLLLVSSFAQAEVPIKAIESTIPTIQQIKTESEKVDPDLLCDIVYYPNLIIELGDNMVFRVIAYVGCGGGNHSESYGILTKRTNDDWSVVDVSEVGSDFVFIVNKLRWSKDILYLDGLKWGKVDPHCCPSVPYTYKYNISNDRLVPIN
jgi:hypothetical protein